jgi:hypothetical protein
MHTGPWVTLKKPPSSYDAIARGAAPVTVIHDDDSARALGYKAGIVGGHTLAAVTWAAIPASLGHPWWEGGVYSVRNRNVSYEGEARAVWERVTPDAGDSGKIAFHLEHRDGNRTTYGWAAVALPSAKVLAPWERNPSPRDIVGEDACPAVAVGASPGEPVEVVLDADKIMERDQNWWFHVASPFGGPVLSPLDIASGYRHAGRLRPIGAGYAIDGQARASMDAGTDIVVYEPVFLGRPYLIGVKTADKWQTARTAFSSAEYAWTDKQTGRLVAASRNYTAFMLRAAAPASTG